MLGQYILTFREVFEAALIVSVMLAYLQKTGLYHLRKYVWIGVAVSVAASVVIGFGIIAVYNGLGDAGAKLFEAIAAFVAVVVLTYAIVFIAKEKFRALEDKTTHAVSKGTFWGIIAFSFIVVFREGLETVLFLTPYMITDAYKTVIGASLGFVTALVLSFMIFLFGVRVSMKHLFFYSSILLVLLAGGLLGYGVHEFLEYLEIIGVSAGFLGSTAFSLPLESGSLFHHKGVIGSIFAVLLGYSAKMEWARVIVHVGYLAVFLPLAIRAYRSKGE